MKNLLSFSESEKKILTIGLLILSGVLLLSNINPLYQGIAALPIWQTKPRQAEFSPNFQLPVYYEGELTALGTVRFVTLDVLVVIYEKIGSEEMSSESVAEIRSGVNLAREFFWRNTNLQLNINPTFLEVKEEVASELLDYEGRVLPKSGLLGDYLLERGVGKNQYDAVFLFYPHPEFVFGRDMGIGKLGKTAYSFVSLPVPEPVDAYPDGPSLTWMFASQLWHSITTVVYDRDSAESESFAELALELQNFSIQDPPKPYGNIYLTLDFDLDGVPDDEPMVPFYEVSLGLNHETGDSDNDGLADKREITAGIFRGTDLFLVDTDGDGLKDGEDTYPLDSERP